MFIILTFCRLTLCRLTLCRLTFCRWIKCFLWYDDIYLIAIKCFSFPYTFSSPLDSCKMNRPTMVQSVKKTETINCFLDADKINTRNYQKSISSEVLTTNQHAVRSSFSMQLWYASHAGCIFMINVKIDIWQLFVLSSTNSFIR